MVATDGVCLLLADVTNDNDVLMLSMNYRDVCQCGGFSYMALQLVDLSHAYVYVFVCVCVSWDKLSCRLLHNADYARGWRLSSASVSDSTAFVLL